MVYTQPHITLNVGTKLVIYYTGKEEELDWDALGTIMTKYLEDSVYELSYKHDLE